MFLFLDLETTGNNTDSDEVLEIAALLVSATLDDVIDEYTTVLRWAPSPEPKIDQTVVAMHARNGLWSECLGLQSWYPYQADDVLSSLCSRRLFLGDKLMLAGNSVWFDRAFMRRKFPRTHELLHHRQLDLSSINEFCKLTPALRPVYDARPSQHDDNHRALSDARASLDLARYYARALGPAAVTP